MDVLWNEVEWSKDQFYFSGYDSLMASLVVNNVTLYWILDFGNPLYLDPINNSTTPETPAQVAAMTNFANATVSLYREYDVVWEMYNKPDNV